MKHLLLVFITIIYASSCSPKMFTSSTNGYSIKELSSDFSGLFNNTKIGLSYKTNQEVVNEMRQVCESKLYTDKECNDYLLGAPDGGFLYVRLVSQNIKTSNTDMWEYIVESPGEGAVIREKGEFNVPEPTVGDLWVNNDVIALSNYSNNTFRVHVVHLSGRKVVFEVTKSI